MTTESCELEFVVATSPKVLFSAWLTSEGHTRITGATAEIHPETGTRFTAWEGYIQGTNLELVSPSRIVQGWRTLEFPADAEDSRVEIALTEVEGGTKVFISHTHIPEGQGNKYGEGWVTHYQEPVCKFFSS